MKTAVKQKRAKLISVTVKIEPDPSPDLSWLKTEYLYEPFSRDPWNGKFVAAELFIGASMRYTNEDVQKYGVTKILGFIRGDEDRMAKYDDGEWTMSGIYAEAEIHIPYRTDGTVKIETIRSGGLWGIESDSGDSYLREVGNEQIAELQSHLKVLNVQMEGTDWEGWEFS